MEECGFGVVFLNLWEGLGFRASVCVQGFGSASRGLRLRSLNVVGTRT